jgi:hypothetical protein
VREPAGKDSLILRTVPNTIVAGNKHRQSPDIKHNTQEHHRLRKYGGACIASIAINMAITMLSWHCVWK